MKKGNFQNKGKEGVCALSGKVVPGHKLLPAKYIRPGVWEMMQSAHPPLKREDFIDIDIVHEYRMKYLEQSILEDKGKVSDLEQDVLKSLDEDKLLTKIEESNQLQSTFGQRLADKIASFGGSWTFILSFLGFIMLWIAVNMILLMNKGWDPYPFILLNLILSCIASLQAPVIMMSQNRQEIKDRKRAEGDYKVNLKAELEIRLLHDKMDYLLQFIDKREGEIQEMQMTLLDEINERFKMKDSELPPS
jgi:uncharacterized membrane protein